MRQDTTQKLWESGGGLCVRVEIRVFSSGCGQWILFGLWCFPFRPSGTQEERETPHLWPVSWNNGCLEVGWLCPFFLWQMKKTYLLYGTIKSQRGRSGARKRVDVCADVKGQMEWSAHLMKVYKSPRQTSNFLIYGNPLNYYLMLSNHLDICKFVICNLKIELI